MRPQPRSSTVEFTAMRRTILILFTVAGLSSQETFAGDCDAHSGCRKFSIYQAAPPYGPPPFVALGSTVGPKLSAAMGSITAQSTVHIPAIFRTRASIMELARPLLGERRNLTKGLFSYMGVVVRLGPGSFQNYQV